MGLEPTTASLEGWRSAIELRPQFNKDYNIKNRKRTGFFDNFAAGTSKCQPMASRPGPTIEI